ncbi:MAG: phospho-N-acetylmuramoyl-pentapeptide-transferase [Clostridia bacterium]|nr:phospho-N-acetylmuramoyl-pentapeptide-transferase [Clostridia bacterium]
MSIIKIVSVLIVTFLLSLLFAPYVLRELRRRHAAQHILEIGPKWHETKAGTPTMGGIIFIIPVTLVVLCFGIVNMIRGDHRLTLGLIFALLCGAIGWIDDSVKIFKARNKGLTVRQKTITLMLIIALYLGAMYLLDYISDVVYVPFINVPLPLGLFYFLVMLPASFFFVNSVNLTDGLDGLVTCVTLPYLIAFSVIAVLTNTALLSNEGMAIFTAALLGGLLAFLVYNFYPAKVFMGDTGSLFLGGCIVALAFSYNAPLLLLLGGIVYFVEGLSVVLQVIYFKLTHGKRLFRMAPIHHHFEMTGKSEVQIVIGMTLLSLLGAILTVAAVLFYLDGVFQL